MSETNSSITVEEIVIPADLRSISEKPGIHESFKTCIDASSCKYISDKGVLRITSKKSDVTKKRINMAKDLHFQMLRNAKEMEVENYLFIEEFDVAEELIGLAIGSKGRNINDINKMKGVQADLLKGTSRFCVKGESQELVNTARERLEYVRQCIKVSRVIGEAIVCEDGALIQNIISKSGVTKIEVGEDDLTEDDEEIPFYFVGPVKKVADAEALFQYYIKAIETGASLSSTKSVSSEESREELNINHKKLRGRKEGKYKYKESVQIPKKFMGLAVGKNGSNIKKAKDLYGVVDIQSRDNTFEIVGNDLNGVKEARKLLDFNEELVEFDYYKSLKIMGIGKANLKEIESKSGVYRINVEESNGNYKFNIIGLAHTIPIAKALMENE